MFIWCGRTASFAISIWTEGTSSPRPPTAAPISSRPLAPPAPNMGSKLLHDHLPRRMCCTRREHHIPPKAVPIDLYPTLLCFHRSGRRAHEFFFEVFYFLR